jgi:CarboxypepD_reg-like domain/TonB-dependent Receptor Plug Domain
MENKQNKNPTRLAGAIKRFTLATKTLQAFLIALIVSIAALQAIAQTTEVGIIKGKVLDKATKQTIPGANILIMGTQKGVATDTSGIFILNNIQEGNYLLSCSFIGFQEKTITDVRVVRAKTTYLEIELAESPMTLNEVQVTSFKYEASPMTPVSMYSFSREEISRNPGAQGDIFRAIGMLPGVSSSGGEYAAIAVRGQGTRENIYMVDDIPLIDLGHLDGNGAFSDPNGARFSIFAPRVIDNAQFQGGGFSPQYGRKSASYLGLGIEEGNPVNPTVDGQLDLLGATVNYDGPSYFHKKTSLFVSARFQDFKAVVNLVGLQRLGLARYQDFIFKSTTQIGTKNKLSVLALFNPETFSRDTSNVRYDTKLEELSVINVSKTKGLVGLNLRTLTSSRSYWKNILYYTQSESIDSYGTSSPKINSDGTLAKGGIIPFENGIRKLKYTESKIGVRSIYTVQLNNSASLTGGIDLDRVEITNYRKLSRPDTLYSFGANDVRPDPTKYFTIVNPAFFNADYAKSAFNASTYMEYSFLLFSQLTINAGARYDYNGFNEQQTISPRISGSWQLDETNSINFASGILFQDPAYSAIADQPQNKKLKNEQVTQVILGYKKYFNPSLKFSVEGWYKQFDNVIVRPINGYSEQNNAGDGWASGIDVNLTKRLTKKVYGQVGYSYMQTKRNNHDGLGEYDFAFSQPNQVNFLVSYKRNKHWVLSTKFRYATGKPTDQFIVHSNVLGNPNNVRYSMETIGRNSDRLPDFISLDVRADYRFQINRLGLTAFIDIVDINNRQNANARSFNAITGKTFNQGISIFPTFGLKFEL